MEPVHLLSTAAHVCSCGKDEYTLYQSTHLPSNEKISLLQGGTKNHMRSWSMGLFLQNQLITYKANLQKETRKIRKFTSLYHPILNTDLCQWNSRFSGFLPYYLFFAFIAWNSNLEPFLEIPCSSNTCRFEFFGFLTFGRNWTDDLGIHSPALWPTELLLHLENRTLYIMATIGRLPKLSDLFCQRAFF